MFANIERNNAMPKTQSTNRTDALTPSRVFLDISVAIKNDFTVELSVTGRPFDTVDREVLLHVFSNHTASAI